MTNICGTICPVPHDHSREALGDLVAPCSLPDGHSGDHSNGRAKWSNAGTSLRALDAQVRAAANGDMDALRAVIDAIVPADDMGEGAQNMRIGIWALTDVCLSFEELRSMVLGKAAA